jgi:selenium-binding protein 1
LAGQPGPGYANPQEAMRSPRETLLYTVGLYTGTSVNAPDYLATVDVDPRSPTYSKVIHRLPMPHVGDELHHFGWNACSSCHGDATRSRRFLVIPGFHSSRIYIVDVADPTAPKLHKTIPAEDIKRKTNLSAPHTVHCLADGRIMIGMLGDAEGHSPGGFLLLNDRFEIAGRWEQKAEGMAFNYDFWYQPRHNVMVSSEFAAPRTYYAGFDPKDVEAGKYGRRLHFWDWTSRTLVRSEDLGPAGQIPLEVRFHHNPQSSHGFVGAALSSTIWHWFKTDQGQWKVEKVIEVPSVEQEGWPFPVPGLITDILISMDDRFLYFSDWLHGDIRQYDIRDPSHPKLTGQVWCGGVIDKKPDLQGRRITGGPQMLQLSLDGKRLYVTNSILSAWDNQFYPDIAKYGSYLLQVDCDRERGGMRLNPNLFVDFGQEPAGPSRAHEMRFPGGDCSSDIFV